VSRPDRLTLTGLGVVAIAAAGTSFDALDGLAGLAGWSHDVRPALPVIVDTLAAVATRAWLSGSTALEAKRFAKRAALASIMVSMVGNTLFHLIASGALHPSVGLVIGVAMIPPLGLATAAHLVAVLRVEEPAAAPEPEAQPLPEPVLLPVDAQPVSVALVPALRVEEPDIQADTTPDIIADSKPDTPRTSARTSKGTDTASKIKRLRERHPDMSVVEIADKVGVTDRTVRRHLRSLATI
jgi:HTH domain